MHGYKRQLHCPSRLDGLRDALRLHEQEQVVSAAHVEAAEGMKPDVDNDGASYRPSLRLVENILCQPPTQLTYHCVY